MECTTLEQFAKDNGLELAFGTRDARGFKITVKFVGAEVKWGSILSKEFGQGDTREEAIAEYSKRISGKLLVISARVPWLCREIQVPGLYTVDKPPLGLIPAHLHRQARALDIIKAMERCLKAGESIPTEWLTELNNLNSTRE